MERHPSVRARYERPQPMTTKIADLFDLEEFRFKDVFSGIEAPWEALSSIGSYIASAGTPRILGKVSPGAWLEGDMISIGAGSVVEPGAMIIGPALIGENCAIRQGAYLRGNVIAGDGSVIGHTTEVKNSIFLNGSKASHFAYVGDSILGSNVNLGAGTKLANFKVDTGERSVSVRLSDGSALPTGRRKLGALIGDGSELGCNSVTMPGAIIGKRCIIYPCSVVRGYVPPDTIIKLRQEFIANSRKQPD